MARPSNIEILHRQALVGRYLIQGVSNYNFIAKRLGCKWETVRNDVEHIEEQWSKHIKPTEKVQWICREMERYEHLLNVHWKKAKKGDIAATGVCLDIIKEERILLGLNEPLLIKDVSGDAIRKMPQKELEIIVQTIEKYRYLKE